VCLRVAAQPHTYRRLCDKSHVKSVVKGQKTPNLFVAGVKKSSSFRSKFFFSATAWKYLKGAEEHTQIVGAHWLLLIEKCQPAIRM